MKNCYKCGVEITAKNSSIEHIIPNAVGGRLKSSELLCKSCNKEFGNETDSYIGSKIPFTLLLNIKRDRGKPYRLEGWDSDGREFHINLNEKTGQLEVKQKEEKPIESKAEDGKTSIKFFSRKQAKDILKKKKKDFDTEQAYKNIKWRKPIKRRIFFEEEQLEGEIASKAISKIAVNFYIHSGGNPSQIKESINHITGRVALTENIVNYFYPDDETVYMNRLEDEVSHTLYLKGIKGGMLYCYVELFTIYQYIVILNKNYRGEGIENLYSFDVLKQKEITEDKKIKLDLDSKSWNNLQTEFSEKSKTEKFDEKKRRVYKIGKLDYK